MNSNFDVIIIGAGAAGLMCAIEAGKRGRSVLLLDHAKKPAEKIRISGGGRCNFTNINATPANFISQNKHFCKSALSQYTQHDFIALVEEYNIPYHEKTLGQLFCDGKSQEIIDMLLNECDKANITLQMNTQIESIKTGFSIKTNMGDYSCASLVIATGGPSIPKMGATAFGYDIAKQFGLNIIEPRAGLVPLTFENELLERCKSLSGVAIEDTIVTCGQQSFREAFLFTHRGLSGPVILQISSYWQEGREIEINMAPDIDVLAFLKEQRDRNPKTEITTIISQIFPKRLAMDLCALINISGRIADLSNKRLEELASSINNWRVIPNGTEGYRTAEVTIGGVDTNEISSKTFETKKVPGLYFIGEAIDVTGHLGGYNFQWAWSSGFIAGQHV